MPIDNLGFDPVFMAQMGALSRAPIARNNPMGGYIQRHIALQALRGGGRMPAQGGGGFNPLLAQGQLDPSLLQSPEFVTKANAMLGHYGLSLPESVGPNAILPNTGFFGNHPRLSGALEGAMFGAMATQPAETLGQGISNVFQGLIGGRQLKNEILSNQILAPFGAAHQMEQLEDMAQKRDLQKAQMDEYASMAKYRQAQMDALGREGKFPPRPEVFNGGYFKYNPKTNDYDIFYDDDIQRAAVARGGNPFGNSVVGQLLYGIMGPVPQGTPGSDAFGNPYAAWDNPKARQDYFQRALGAYGHISGMTAGAQAGGRLGAEQNAGKILDDVTKDQIADLRHQRDALDSAESRKRIIMQVYGKNPKAQLQDVDAEIQRQKAAIDAQINQIYSSVQGQGSPMPKGKGGKSKPQPTAQAPASDPFQQLVDAYTGHQVLANAPHFQPTQQSSIPLPGVAGPGPLPSPYEGDVLGAAVDTFNPFGTSVPSPTPRGRFANQ